MTWLFSLLKSWAGLALAAGGGLLVLLFQRWRIKRKDAVIDRQEHVIKAHEAKEQVHEQDRELEKDADTQINDIRERVDTAESPEKAAQAVADGLNEFFGSKE